MKGRKASIIGAVLVGVCAVLAGPRDELWKQVKEATGKRRPRTAAEHLGTLYSQATAAGAHAEAARALAQKINQEARIEGSRAEEKIERMHEALESAPEAQVPVLEAILGHWYWQYFQQNRWQIMQRTQTASPPGDDIRTWGLPRLFDEIGKHFEAALESKEQLLDTPIEEYGELLDMGTAPAEYRPTLYDFLAFEALSFYSSGEQAGATPEDAFVLEASSPVFGSLDDFLGWEIATTDTDSPIYKALTLYQALLRTRRNADAPAALADADLHRLRFGGNHAVGPEKTNRYLDALAKFATDHADHPIWARAQYLRADALRDEGKLVEAQKIAAAAMEAYPDSVGGKRCFNLNQQLQTPALTVHTERVWNAPWPDIQVDYKNLTELHFRIVELEWVDPSEWQRDGAPEAIDRDRMKRLLEQEPAAAWSTELPATEDFQMARHAISVPEDLPNGLYALIGSPDADFQEEDNQVSATAFWVSGLAVVVTSHTADGKAGGHVLDGRSGAPLAGARVKHWFYGRRRNWRDGGTVQTDENGEFDVQVGERARNSIFVVEQEGDRLASGSIWQSRSSAHQRNPSEVTVLFTDRAIYRPGQTVRYKGICTLIDQAKNKYETLANRDVEVIFRDRNGKEIAKQQHTTNDFGSFSGRFTAPRDRLTGAMSLRCTAPGGMARIRVEEYKRPKFRVVVKAPETPAKLGERVALTGEAQSYTGAPIDGANVRYRVVREVRYPPWIGWYCWWWRPSPASQQEIAHGTTKTEVDGTFTVSFPALPDRSIPEDNEPIFRYTITADVTDSTGETRSGQRTVSAGYTALSATLGCPDWIEANESFELTVSTQSLDREPQAASGTVEIYALKAPDSVHRTPLASPPHYLRRGGGDAPNVEPDLSNPDNWELAEVVAQSAFETDDTGTTKLEFELPAGHYRAKLSTTDRFGKEVKALRPLEVLDPEADRCVLRVPYLLRTPQRTVEPGETFRALWGTGYETGRAHIEIHHRGRVLQSYWTDAGATQATIAQDVTEEMRGGFSLHVFMVRENRLYATDMQVQVPWSNKELTVKWESFRSKLKPGQEETWTAVVAGPDAEPAVAEFAATLYDASLDAFVTHSWPGFGGFYTDYRRSRRVFQNSAKRLSRILGGWDTERADVRFAYPEFLAEVIGRRLHRRGEVGFGNGFGGGARRPARAMMMADRSVAFKSAKAPEEAPAPGGDFGRASAPPPPPPEPEIDLGAVAARTNLEETAFFYPHLTSGEDGTVRMEFTMPEALTEWRFMGFAHDRELRSGRLDATVTTSKDLMVRPNPPRFLREGDELEFTVKVVNQSEQRQRGHVRLTFRHARTNDPTDEALGNTKTDKPFDIPAKQSRSFTWRISVPDGQGFLVYKAVAATDALSDGEENFLPVLPSKILVREAMQLHVRGKEKKAFTLKNLAQAGQSDTLRHQSLTVQIVSNPSWYAVLALPYLAEQPHECVEQTVSRLYANALARSIADSNPRIRRTFEQWRNTEALDSALEKNEDLKSVMLRETPWMLEADDERETRRNVGQLFESNRLKREIRKALRKVKEIQHDDGGWPWFPGGKTNRYVTQYIACAFARLRHLGVDGIDMAPAIEAVGYLDRAVDEQFRDLRKHKNLDESNLSPFVALYLYTRSFYLGDVDIQAEHREAVDYFIGQAAKHWTGLSSRQSQAHVAIALKRFDKGGETPNDIVVSLRERAKQDEEMGMYWATAEECWWWYHAPVETQARMIELFDEVARDKEAVEACKVWLLKQKQTSHWRSTKATADAVHALLSRGTNLLADTSLATLSVADETVEPKNVEAGTGFYTKRFTGPEVTPEMSTVTVEKETDGIAWGGVHWQYFESVEKVPAHAGTPLEIKKDLYVKRDSRKGPVLHRVRTANLRVGDEVVVRLELRSDRDMEFVHLKDDRGSGLEPVNVLSQYRWQDGLGYYEATRDTATHFYIDRLPKGTYVFEYSLRVQHGGEYQSGIAHVECMYAPEFNSHSASALLEVTKR